MVARRDETDQWSVVGINNQRLSSHITVVAGRVGVDLQVGLWQHQQLVVLLQLQPPLRRLRGRAHGISCGNEQRLSSIAIVSVRRGRRRCVGRDPTGVQQEVRLHRLDRRLQGRRGAILRAMDAQLLFLRRWTDTCHNHAE